MTFLALILIVAVLFAVILSYESGGGVLRLPNHPIGLLSWLTSGNWPAKVGAGLIIIGIGALLRYAFANIDVPPEVKLGSGVLAAGALGFGSMLLRNQPKRRAVHLALAGAAFGVAYLTAYSAYGFFNYITDVNALALLALVAVAAGVFAVQSHVMSVAVLAMAGAYIAPKFALGTPGILPVYGYYLACSVLSLIMVTLRGWRPLIHLSFLFTLAGALFFGWSGRFYEPGYYGQMQPILLALTAVHLAMPLVEIKFVRSPRFTRFDAAYFILLPLVAAALTLKIAPNVHAEGALGLGALALIWGAAAVFLFARNHAESARHALVATALATCATLSWFQDLPLLLVGLGLSVALLVVTSLHDELRRAREIACGAAMVFGALHIVQSISLLSPPHAFFNELFAHRLIAGMLMVAGAVAGIRGGASFAKILGVTGAGWLTLAIVNEIVNLNIDYLPQLAYGVILGALMLYALLVGMLPKALPVGIGLVWIIAILGHWAAYSSSPLVAMVYLVIAPAVLLGMAHAIHSSAPEGSADLASVTAIGLLPLIVQPWAASSAPFVGVRVEFYAVTITMVGIVIAGLAGRRFLTGSTRWDDHVQPLHLALTAVALLWVTLFHIERGPWPVMFEILALGYLLSYVIRRNSEQARVRPVIAAVTVLSVALVLQAMLLRGFGPGESIMTAADINRMQLPAVASLMWVVFGAGLAWWGASTKDRSLWSVGAGLLAVAAFKLVFFDFGTLGQLGNILAFIVAGAVFMGVAWLAPIPPKAERPARYVKEMGLPTPIPSAPEAQETIPEPAKDAQPKANDRIHLEEPAGGVWRWLLIWGLIVVVALLAVQNHRARIYKEQQRAIESGRYPSSPLAGVAGVEDSVNRRLIRMATEADADAWLDAALKDASKPGEPITAGQALPRPARPATHGAYVVLKAFTYPSGLFGSQAVTFLIPRGVPRPQGHPGDSTIYDINSARCDGPRCANR